MASAFPSTVRAAVAGMMATYQVSGLGAGIVHPGMLTLRPAVRRI